MFDSFLSIPWAVNILGLELYKGLEYAKFYVNCILKILSNLNVLSPEYVKVLNISGV